MAEAGQELVHKLQQKVHSLTEELLETYEELNLMFDMAEMFSSMIDYEKVNQTVLLEAVDFMEADRGWLVSYNPETGLITNRNRYGVSWQVCSFFNANIVLDVVKKGKPAVINDLPEKYAIPSENGWPGALICVPLKTKDEVLGAITLGRDNPDFMFTAGDQKLLMVLCTQSATAIKNAALVTNLQELYEELREQDRIRGALGRYLPLQLVEKVIGGKEQIKLGGERVHATILFADIRGFTSIMSSMEPETVVELLNRYFSVMIDMVFRHQGTLDKIMGDAVMAVFGAPIAHEDDELRAVKAGLDMQRGIRELNDSLVQEGKKPINVGMGIATGIVISGNVGSKDRMEFTVMGDPVNVAFRVQNLADQEQVLITGSTYQHLIDQVVVNELEPIRVKGKTELIDVYEVIKLRAET